MSLPLQSELMATAIRWSSSTCHVKRERRLPVQKDTLRYDVLHSSRTYKEKDCRGFQVTILSFLCLSRTMNWMAVTWIPPMMRKSGTVTAQGMKAYRQVLSRVILRLN